MGFELNRIMKQYGVSTPGMANYSGATAPSTDFDSAYYAKANPDLAKAKITTPEQLLKHYTDTGKKEGRAGYDQAAFGEQMRKYGLDQTSYDQYKSDYQNRLSNTPMYLQSQFDTGYGTTASTTPTGSAMRAAADKPGGIGVDQANRSIQNWFAQNPNASASEIEAVKKQFDVTDADVKNAMGSGFAYGDGKPSGYGSTGVRYANAPGGVGMDKYNQNINTWLKDNPYATTAQIKAEGDKWGVSNKDIYNATGSYYGNQLKGPTYGAVPLSLVNQTPQNKADYYLQQRNIGYTDADLRNATTSTFGKPAETDWTELLNRAYPQYVKPVTEGYASIGRTGFTGNTAIDNPGYNYWMDQLAGGAIKPEDLNARMEAVAFPNGRPTVTLPNTDSILVKGTGTDGYIGGTGGGNLGGVNVINSNGSGNTTTNSNNWLYSYLNQDSDPLDISKAYSQYVGAYGGDTADNRTAAADYLKKLGISDNSINSAYNSYLSGVNVINPLTGNNVTQKAHGGSVHDMAAKYAMGGQVKTHYQTAGAVKLPSGYGSVEEEQDFANRFFQPSGDVVVNPVNMESPPPPVTTDLTAAPPAPKSALTEIAVSNAAEPMIPAVTAEKPVAVAPKAAVPLGGERMANIQALLAAYGPKDSAYAADLKTARAAAKAESDAFANMLKTAMSSPEDAQSSKAEMYFRLAAAFGAPTKTGQFSENLGMVGKELGEYAKNKRASGQQKLALGLEAQKLRMGAAKEDLNTLRTLAGEEMKDKRTIATELIKDYIKSGEPQSTAGKQALDEGLKPGTEAYQKRVAEIGNLNVEAKMAQITGTLQNLSLAQANFALNQDKFNQQKAQQAKLTGPELKLKTEAEDLIASSKQSLADLKQAYALNPNSLAGGWLDKGQQFLSEAAGSKDPVIVNTRILNNLLGSQGLAKLKATFGGAPTEGERAILMELEGIGSKTKEERAAIIKRTYKVLQDRVAREQTRLDQITSGAYRTTTPLDGGTD